MSDPISRPLGPPLVPSLAQVQADRSVLDRLPVDALLAIRRELGHLGVDVDMALTVRQLAPDPAQPAEAADRYLTVGQVAERTGLSPSHLYELARRGDLPARPMGTGKRPRSYRILFSDLLAWEASRARNAVVGKVSNMLRSFP